MKNNLVIELPFVLPFRLSKNVYVSFLNYLFSYRNQQSN